LKKIKNKNNLGVDTMKYEITFPELCALKREKLGLTKDEAMKRIGYTNYLYFEKGKATPRPMLTKIIEFYGITNEEIEACKDYKPNQETETKSTTGVSIKSMLDDIEELFKKTEQLTMKGALGKKLINEAIEKLKIAEESLTEISILDELVK